MAPYEWPGRYALDTRMDLPVPIRERPLERDDVLLRRDADRLGHGRVHAQNLTIPRYARRRQPRSTTPTMTASTPRHLVLARYMAYALAQPASGSSVLSSVFLLSCSRSNGPTPTRICASAFRDALRRQARSRSPVLRLLRTLVSTPPQIPGTRLPALLSPALPLVPCRRRQSRGCETRALASGSC